MADFEVGDIVMFNSGSEMAMTVEKVTDDKIHCVWFNGKKVERSSSPAATLRKYGNPFSGFEL